MEVKRIEVSATDFFISKMNKIKDENYRYFDGLKYHYVTAEDFQINDMGIMKLLIKGECISDCKWIRLQPNSMICTFQKMN